MISVIQNDRPQLELLAAMRETYSAAKRLLAIQWWFGIPFAIALSLIVILFPASKVWSVFIGLALALIVEFGLEPLVKTRSKLAAQIQETFDCKVLDLTWNKYHCGNPPDIEDIHSSSKRYIKSKKSFDKLKDWYSPEVDQIPLHLARLVCQQSNLRWDVVLRRRYRAAVYCSTATVTVVLLGIALAQKQTVGELILHVLGCSSPAILWGLKEAHKQSACIESLTSLKSLEDRVWHDSLTEPDPRVVGIAAREVQNAIFIRRASNPLIFDFFYWIFKDDQEEELAVRASYRIQEALATTQQRGDDL